MAEQVARDGENANPPADRQTHSPAAGASQSQSPLTNIFSDEFALQPFEVADGFRPSTAQPSSNNESPPSTSAAPETRSSTTSLSITPTPPPPAALPKSSSDTKAPPQHSRFSDSRNSFSLRNDGPSRHITRRPQNPASASAALTRTSSNTSSLQRVRSQGPYQPNGGPSFPYALYPQQDSIAVGNPSQIGPVGFPGQVGFFQNGQGAQGDQNGDIIGPDGYAEQLPPYSKYPDGVRPDRSSISTPVSPLGPAGAENPFNSSADSQTETLNQPGSRQSQRSLASSHSRAQMTVVDPNSSNDSSSDGASGGMKEKIKTKGKKRLCGLPMWAIILAVVLLVIIVALVGGMTGAFLGHKSAEKQIDHEEEEGTPSPNAVSTAPTVTITKTFDASPLATAPSGLPMLPTGTYTMPLATPNRETNFCLKSANQISAWSCQFSDQTHSIITVQAPLTSRGLPQLSFTHSAPPDRPIYGAFPPSLPSAQPLILVTDTDVPAYGPSHFFQTSYDKKVLVSGDMLAFDKRRKRAYLRQPRRYASTTAIHPTSTASTIAPSQTPGSTAQPGDQPWLCFWNNTLLEGFIYPQKDSPAARNDAQYYPKILKLEERRNPDPPSGQQSQPYCVRMQVLDNGKMNPITDPATGSPVVLTLDESHTQYSAAPAKSSGVAVSAAANGYSVQAGVQSGWSASTRDVERRAVGDQGQCHCEWVVPAK